MSVSQLATHLFVIDRLLGEYYVSLMGIMWTMYHFTLSKGMRTNRPKDGTRVYNSSWCSGTKMIPRCTILIVSGGQEDGNVKV